MRKRGETYYMIFDIVLIIIACCMLIFSPVSNTQDTQYVNDQKVISENAEKQGMEAADETDLTADIPEEPETEPARNIRSASAEQSEEYAAAGVDELNSVPILMYHRIYEMTNDETEYTGGNVDADGYNRTSEALENDLEQYYQWGYRMIRLDDYLDGNIDVEYGYSPIIITFDDGLDQAKVVGFDEDGYPLFSEYSALAVLESVKKRHPDFNVTATFFVNGGLFGNTYEDDVKLMNWMVDNGYDIGNHTWNHAYLDIATEDEIQEQVGRVYELLDEIIPGKYVNILAEPFGIPNLDDNDPKYDYIFDGYYNGKHYTTKAALLCAWTRQVSPFNIEYDNRHLLRIRGYDNNGKEFDIQMNFEFLNSGGRYISDGDPDTIVIHEEDEVFLGETFGKEIITY